MKANVWNCLVGCKGLFYNALSLALESSNGLEMRVKETGDLNRVYGSYFLGESH